MLNIRIGLRAFVVCAFILFVGTGTTVRLGSPVVTQNGTNFSNSGTIVTFCDNKTDTNPIPGAVTTNCLK